MKLSNKPVFVASIISAVAIVVFLAGAKVSLFADEAVTPSASNVSVVPIQTGPQSYGLAMIDSKNQTLWIYEINSHGPSYSKLKLIAARSFRYDRLLENYNSAEPKPEQVRDIIRQTLKSPANQGIPAKPSQTPGAIDVNVSEPNTNR